MRETPPTLGRIPEHLLCQLSCSFGGDHLQPNVTSQNSRSKVLFASWDGPTLSRNSLSPGTAAFLMANPRVPLRIEEYRLAS
ncbi:hypothetical protein DPEC_G00244090 [Dallia pectoralis]|uniref:Uncharacterized protein n=1 Tax=Dallia pectoralis TaxID=75939 RepID=A0ACC2FVL8_DALPE|nr:hypothetical protein DPEC_G00244090 [Dallia pectoralis]